MPSAPYYRTDLAWIHHTGYAGHVESTSAGILAGLRTHGIGAGQRVLDVGCGSGLLARALLDAGYEVSGIDASPAMIELARAHAPGGDFQVLALPGAAPLSPADAVVSTGHVLNYLDSRAEIGRALVQLAAAVRPGGLLAIDLVTERFAEARDIRHPHARVQDDWVLVTRFSRPAPHRFDRDITVFRRVDGTWQRSDEHHANVTFEVEDALQILRAHGVEAECTAAFGEEALPEGMTVLKGTKRRAT